MQNLELISRFRQAARLFHEFERMPHDFGNGELVYASEVHCLIQIGECPGLSVTELAKRLRISKPSAAEIVKKLERRDLVFRTTATANASRHALRLSERGQEILELHERRNAGLQTSFKRYCESLSPEKVAVLADFFAQFESFMLSIKDERKPR